MPHRRELGRAGPRQLGAWESGERFDGKSLAVAYKEVQAVRAGRLVGFIDTERSYCYTVVLIAVARPNNGFIQQLREYERQLLTQRLASSSSSTDLNHTCQNATK